MKVNAYRIAYIEAQDKQTMTQLPEQLEEKYVTSALNYLSRKTNGGVCHLDHLVSETASNDETKMRSACERHR